MPALMQRMMAACSFSLPGFSLPPWIFPARAFRQRFGIDRILHGYSDTLSNPDWRSEKSSCPTQCAPQQTSFAAKLGKTRVTDRKFAARRRAHSRFLAVTSLWDSTTKGRWCAPKVDFWPLAT